MKNPAAAPSSPGYKSKTLATWLALVGGSVGLHRFYLHGFRDAWGWLFIVPSTIGSWTGKLSQLSRPKMILDIGQSNTSV